MANVDMSVRFALRKVIGGVTYPRHASVRDVEREDERQKEGEEFLHRLVDSNASGDAVWMRCRYRAGACSGPFATLRHGIRYRSSVPRPFR